MIGRLSLATAALGLATAALATAALATQVSAQAPSTPRDSERSEAEHRAPTRRDLESTEAITPVPNMETPAAAWGTGERRWFVSGAFDLGFLYARPRVSFGFGQPHHRWVGLDLNPILQERNVAVYGGLRVTHPFIDWRIGARFNVGVLRSYLEPKDSYAWRDFNVDNGTTAHHVTYESELTLSLPVGPHEIFSETAVSYVAGVPDGMYVLENIIRAIVAPPWVWRSRVGALVALGRARAVRIGVAAELVGVPGRDLLIFRAGLLLRVDVSARLQIRASWIPAIASRDRLGIRGGDFGLLGLRWSFATAGR